MFGTWLNMLFPLRYLIAHIMLFWCLSAIIRYKGIQISATFIFGRVSNLPLYVLREYQIQPPYFDRVKTLSL